MFNENKSSADSSEDYPSSENEATLDLQTIAEFIQENPIVQTGLLPKSLINDEKYSFSPIKLSLPNTSYLKNLELPKLPVDIKKISIPALLPESCFGRSRPIIFKTQPDEQSIAIANQNREQWLLPEHITLSVMMFSDLSCIMAMMLTCRHFVEVANNPELRSRLFNEKLNKNRVFKPLEEFSWQLQRDWVAQRHLRVNNLEFNFNPSTTPQHENPGVPGANNGFTMPNFNSQA